MLANMRIGRLQRVDEAEHGARRVFAQIIVKRLIDILLGKRSWNDRFGLYPRALRTLARKDSK
jgi:hypothetical protein